MAGTAGSQSLETVPDLRQQYHSANEQYRSGDKLGALDTLFSILENPGIEERRVLRAGVYLMISKLGDVRYLGVRGYAMQSLQILEQLEREFAEMEGQTYEGLEDQGHFCFARRQTMAWIRELDREGIV